jgi:MoxR-like ATPase
MAVEGFSPALSRADVDHMIEVTRSVAIRSNIERYIVELARATRVDDRVQLGVSPRGCVAVARAAAALAAADGWDYVVVEHVQEVVPHVFPHRIVLRSEALIADHKLTAETVVADALATSNVPTDPGRG